MFRKVLTLILVTAAFALTAPAWSYDASLANSYDAMFAPAQGGKNQGPKTRCGTGCQNPQGVSHPWLNFTRHVEHPS